MKTEKETKEIWQKIEKGKELEPSEMCEGFYIEDGVATDRKLHGGVEWDEEDEWAAEVFRKNTK
ncbi:MAG: hypothetical protein GXX85_14405 [Ignavibacteria bacterium]|mgnify:CR=1 FL=1|jgi:hypothetical protein|nr:hypothetical protein [Ignavibacteria bacterium]